MLCFVLGLVCYFAWAALGNNTNTAMISTSVNEIDVHDLQTYPITHIRHIFSTEAEPIWRRLQFAASGHVLADQGAGHDVAAVEENNNDATLWSLVGRRKSLYLKSMQGNYLAYDAKANRYTTSSNEHDKVILTLRHNTKNSWTLERKGSDQLLSEIPMIRPIRGAVGDASSYRRTNKIRSRNLMGSLYIVGVHKVYYNNNEDEDENEYS